MKIPKGIGKPLMILLVGGLAAKATAGFLDDLKNYTAAKYDINLLLDETFDIGKRVRNKLNREYRGPKVIVNAQTYTDEIESPGIKEALFVGEFEKNVSDSIAVSKYGLYKVYPDSNLITPQELGDSIYVWIKQQTSINDYIQKDPNFNINPDYKNKIPNYDGVSYSANGKRIKGLEKIASGPYFLKPKETEINKKIRRYNRVK